MTNHLGCYGLVPGSAVEHVLLLRYVIGPFVASKVMCYFPFSFQLNFHTNKPRAIT